MEQDPIFNKIEAYLDERLPDTERQTFEQEIAQNPELATQVELQRFERDAMEVLVEEDLRDEMKVWKQQMLNTYSAPREAQTRKLRIRRIRILAIAASLLIILTAGALYWFGPFSDSSQAVADNRQDTPPPSEIPQTPAEEEQQKENQPIAQLTDPQKKGEEETETQETVAEQKTEPKEQEPTEPQTIAPNIQKAPQVATQNSTLELAQDYFDDQFLKRQQIADNEALAKLIEAYNNRNYQQAVSLAAEVKDPYPLAQEFLGAAYFQLSQFDRAQRTFGNLMRLSAGDTGLQQRTEWNLLLTYLAQDQTNYAEFDRLLNRISGNESHLFFDEADALKEKLY